MYVRRLENGALKPSHNMGFLSFLLQHIYIYIYIVTGVILLWIRSYSIEYKIRKIAQVRGNIVTIYPYIYITKTLSLFFCWKYFVIHKRVAERLHAGL